MLGKRTFSLNKRQFDENEIIKVSQLINCITSRPTNINHIVFSEFDRTYRTLSVSVVLSILNTLSAKQMRAGFQYHLSLSLGPTNAHYFRFVFLHLHANHIILRLLLNELQFLLQLSHVQLCSLLILNHFFYYSLELRVRLSQPLSLTLPLLNLQFQL